MRNPGRGTCASAPTVGLDAHELLCAQDRAAVTPEDMAAHYGGPDRTGHGVDGIYVNKRQRAEVGSGGDPLHDGGRALDAAHDLRWRGVAPLPVSSAAQRGITTATAAAMPTARTIAVTQATCRGAAAAVPSVTFRRTSR